MIAAPAWPAAIPGSRKSPAESVAPVARAYTSSRRNSFVSFTESALCAIANRVAIHPTSPTIRTRFTGSLDRGAPGMLATPTAAAPTTERPPA